MMFLLIFLSCGTRAAAQTQKHTNRKGSTMTQSHPASALTLPPQDKCVSLFFCSRCLQLTVTLSFSSSLSSSLCPCSVWLIASLPLPGFPLWYRWRFECSSCWKPCVLFFLFCFLFIGKVAGSQTRHLFSKSKQTFLIGWQIEPSLLLTFLWGK